MSREAAGQGALSASLGWAFTWLSPITIAGAALWFGAGGLLLEGMSSRVALAVAIVAAVIGAVIVRTVMAAFVRASTPPLQLSGEGAVATVNAAIRADAPGEVVYTLEGLHRSTPARSENGTVIPRGTPVVIGQPQGRKIEAEGEAAATLARADADAQATKVSGLAQAEALRARGLAEAQALQRRVEVLNVQNQAALLDKALGAMPEIAGRLSEAYGKIGQVTYIAAGDGEGITSRISRDVVGMVPMLGAMFESVTGMKLKDMLGRQNGSAAIAHESSADAAPVPDAVPVERLEESMVSTNGSGDGPVDAPRS